MYIPPTAGHRPLLSQCEPSAGWELHTLLYCFADMCIFSHGVFRHQKLAGVRCSGSNPRLFKKRQAKSLGYDDFLCNIIWLVILVAGFSISPKANNVTKIDPNFYSREFSKRIKNLQLQFVRVLCEGNSQKKTSSI